MQSPALAAMDLSPVRLRASAFLPAAAVAAALVSGTRPRRRGAVALQERCGVAPLRCGGMDDVEILRQLRERGQQIEENERERAAIIAENWKEGRAMMGPCVRCEDWVRRVALLGDDLFVGTASSGVHRYRLGSSLGAALRQRLPVRGDPDVMVAADHRAGADPETSITSIAWDGQWLAAGTAGGSVHLWDAEGRSVLEAGPAVAGGAPCYVGLVAGGGLGSGTALAAAAGESLRRWELPRGGQKTGSLAAPQLEMLPCRAHCLAPWGERDVFVVGLANGSLEVRGALDLCLQSSFAVHESAVSAFCALADGGIMTGDDSGEAVRWRIDDLGFFGRVWQERHNARVVAIGEGGGGIVVTGALDGTIRAWETETGEPRFVVQGHKVWFGSLCVDDGVMVTDGRDNAVYLYDFRVRSNASDEER